MADDFDASAKSKPKKGRRAKVLLSGSKESGNENPAVREDKTDSAYSMLLENESTAPGPHPSRRQLGWNQSISNEVLDSRLEVGQLSDEEKDDNILSIPDLDEIHEDDITQEIAAPPSVYTAKIASYGELDMDLMNRSAFRTLDGDIDLKVLVKNLVSETDVRAEEDGQWNWDHLFAEVSASLRPKLDNDTDQISLSERAV